jgi:hypothetical protein
MRFDKGGRVACREPSGHASGSRELVPPCRFEERFSRLRSRSSCRRQNRRREDFAVRLGHAIRRRPMPGLSVLMQVGHQVILDLGGCRAISSRLGPRGLHVGQVLTIRTEPRRLRSPSTWNELRRFCSTLSAGSKHPRVTSTSGPHRSAARGRRFRPPQRPKNPKGLTAAIGLGLGKIIPSV